MTSSSKARLAAAAAAMALAALLYAGTLGHPAVWDDHVFLLGQPFLRACGSLPRVLAPEAWLRPLPVRGSARPAWLLSVLLDTCAGGGRMLAYRVSNVFWHAAGAACVGALAWELSASLPACAAAALLFAAHPAHVEAVNVVTFRSDLMCLVFMTLSLLLYREALRARGRRAALSAGASLACAAAALLSKEMAVTLPLLAWLTDRLAPVGVPGRRRAAWAGLAAAAALVAAYLAFRAPRSGYVMASSEDLFSALRDGGRPAQPAIQDPPWSAIYSDRRARSLTMSAVLGRELRRLAWPGDLQADYAPAVPRAPWDPSVLWGWAAVALVLAGAWALRRRPLAGVGLAWAAATLLPVAGIIALYNPEADRYLYVPSAGACLAAAAAFDAAWRDRRRWARPVAALTLAALVCLGAREVVRRSAFYADDWTLLQSVVAADPDVPRARLGLALIAEDRGDLAEAREQLMAARKSAPGYRRAQIALEEFERRHPAAPVRRGR